MNWLRSTWRRLPIRSPFAASIGPAFGWRCLCLPLVVAAGVLLIDPPNVRAELLEVRQVASGMECPECARGLQILVKEIDGVETAATSWNRRMLTVHFRSGNHATLSQIRALVVRQHFQVREAEVVVAGRLLVDAHGQASLVVPESGLTYRIDPGAPRTIDWIHALGSPAAIEVVVTGRVPAGADADRPDDPLMLWALDIRDAKTAAAARSANHRQSESVFRAAI